jgi:hypothetical protein
VLIEQEDETIATWVQNMQKGWFIFHLSTIEIKGCQF